jgi:hypothetical protein
MIFIATSLLQEMSMDISIFMAALLGSLLGGLTFFVYLWMKYITSERDSFFGKRMVEMEDDCDE